MHVNVIVKLALLLKSSLVIGWYEHCSQSGVATHEEITHQALFQTQLNRSSSEINEILLGNDEYLQAGAFFPDWGYSCGNASAEAELAHWPPFWEAAIAHIKSKYAGSPLSNQAKQLVSFLLGTVSHGVADVLWHSLYMNQGFIQAMSNVDFQSDYKSAHTTADIGGDLWVSRFGNLNYLNPSWKVPTDDLIEIYQKMNRNVTRVQLNSCMALGFSALIAERTLGRLASPLFEEKSPFLTTEFYSYFRGGIQSMSVAVAECWVETTQWIHSDKVNVACKHLGSYKTPMSSSWQGIGAHEGMGRIGNCLQKIPNWLTVKDIAGITAITSKDVSTVAVNACVLAEQFEPSSIGDIIKKGIMKASANVLQSAMEAAMKAFRDKGKLPPSTTITANLDYMKLGAALATGDFKGSGVKDLVLGAPGNSTTFSIQNGAVFLIPSQKLATNRICVSEVSTIINGPAENGVRFGAALAVVDLNKDGIDDLAISAPTFGARDELQNGKVYVLFGKKGVGLRMDGGFDLIINGFDPSSDSVDQTMVLGSKLEGLDVDSDGFVDLVIGSPLASLDANQVQIGAIHVFYAKSLHYGEKSHKTADWSVFGSQPYQNFGSSISKDDKFIYFGSPGFESVGAVQRYSLTTKVYAGSIVGKYPLGRFGSQVANINNTLAVAAPVEVSKYSSARPLNLPGLLTKDAGYQAGVVRFYKTFDDANPTTAYGASSLGRFGTTVLTGPNNQFYTSEPFAFDGRGHVYNLSQFSGSDLKMKESASYLAGQPNERFGSNLLLADMNGDGSLDLVISSENDPESDLKWSSGIQSGKVQILWNVFQK